MSRRLAFLPFALVVLVALPGCEPAVCRQLQDALERAACGESIELNRGPRIENVFMHESGFNYDGHTVYPRVGENITFRVEATDPDADALYYEWDFDGDGTVDETSYDASIIYAFPRSGRFTVKLRVTDFPKGTADVEGEAIWTHTLRAHTQEEFDRDRPPIARFTASPNPVTWPFSMRFDGTGSSDPDGDRLDYSWEVPGPDMHFGEQAISLRLPIGSHPIGMHVYDEYGKAATAYRTATVIAGNAPVARLYIARNPTTTRNSVDLSAEDSTDPNGDIAYYEWQPDVLGSPNIVIRTTAPVYSLLYPEAGTFRVRVTVYDATGLSSSDEQDLQVSGPPPATDDPVARLGVDPNPARLGEEIAFTAGASSDPRDDIVRYEWDLDGVEGYEEAGPDDRVTRVFYESLDYIVRLRVVDSSGNSDVAARRLVVTSEEVRMAATRRPRLGPSRPFSARVTGGAGGGKLRASLSGPRKLTKAEQLVRRFLAARWRTRLDVAVDKAAGRATVRGTALATAGRRGDRACVRLSVVARPGRLPRGTFRVAGGTGAAAGLYGEGSFRFRVAKKGTAIVVGHLRAGYGGTRAAPRTCGR